MIHNGRVLGLPLVQFTDSKAAIEALSAERGMVTCTTDTGELGFYDGTSWWWLKGGGTSSWDKIILWHPAGGADAVRQFPCTQSGLDQANALAVSGDYIFFPPGEHGPLSFTLRPGVVYGELMPGQTTIWHDGNGADTVIATETSAGPYYLQVHTIRMNGAGGGTNGLYAFRAYHNDNTAYIYADLECSNTATGVEAKACALRVDGAGKVVFRGAINVLSAGKHYGAYGVQLYAGTVKGDGDIAVQATNGFAYGIQIRGDGMGVEWDGSMEIIAGGPSSWPNEYPDSGYAVGIQVRSNAKVVWYGTLIATSEQADTAGLSIYSGSSGSIYAHGEIIVYGNDRGTSGLALYDTGTIDFTGSVEAHCDTAMGIAAYGVTVEAAGTVTCRGRIVVQAHTASSYAYGLRVSDGTLRAEYCSVSTSAITAGLAYDLYQAGTGTLEAFCVLHDATKVSGAITWMDGVDVRSLTGYAQGSLIVGGATDWETLAHPGNTNRVLQSSASGVRWSDSEPLMLDQSIPQTLSSSPIFGNLTAGRIPYVSTAKTLTDSDRLVWDEANQSLGIGTATPGYLIHAYQNKNATVSMAIANDNTGAAAIAAYRAINDSGHYVILGIGGSGVSPTTYAAFADRPALFTDLSASGLSLVARSPTGDIRFYTGGVANSNERARIDKDGNVGIGAPTPATLLHARKSDTATNTVTDILTLEHESTNTPAVGFGGSINMLLESSTTEKQNAARIVWQWETATHASRKAELIGYVSDYNGEREGWRIRATGSAPAIGFLGATPIPRQPHIADPSGGSVVDVEARNAINAILDVLEGFGFVATS